METNDNKQTYIRYDHQLFGPLNPKAAALLRFHLDSYGVDYDECNEPMPADDCYDENETLTAVLGL